MSNFAIILAGGEGGRMHSNIPKQFINVYDKPILMYTLDAFQKHPQIEAVEVVCVDGWEDVTSAYAKQYGIDKLRWITKGGKTAQESIYNGILNLIGKISDEDFIVIHDGIRPLVDDFVLTDVLKVAKEKGNAISALPYNEQIFVMNEENTEVTEQYIPRETIRRVCTPQAYQFKVLRKLYQKAFKEKIGIGANAYADTLMADMNQEIYFAAGSDKNIKIVTQDDLDMFKAYLKRENDMWLK